MAIRLIAGRAGSGKTHHCLARIVGELETSRTEGPRLILLVPEQAGLQMERALLSMLSPPALGRCEVLSFRRLAHRILNDSSGSQPIPMTPTGRQMALRYIIARQSRTLREFSKVSDRPGFLASIADGIVELLQETVTPDDLDAAAKSAESDNDPTSPRLHDMAVIYRAYLDYLGTQRIDPEAVLDLARTQLTQLSWPDGARIWIDGFAGLTRQQVRMVVALAERAAGVDVALLLDPAMRRVSDLDAAPDDLSLFARTERTWFALARAARDAGVGTDDPVVLGDTELPRFIHAAQIADVERSLFRVQPRTKDSAGTGDEKNVYIIRAPDRRAEVEAVMAALIDLVQRPNAPLRYRDIAIVVRDLTPYHDLISAALAARGIPFFIDRRRPTYHHSLVQFVRALLEIPGGGAFDQSIITILKTGLSGLDDAASAALENYVLAHGLGNSALWENDWPFAVKLPSRADRNSQTARAALAAVNASREFLLHHLADWLPREETSKDRPACREWLTRLVAVIERFDIRKSLAAWSASATKSRKLDEAAEHEQVWDDLVKLLDEAADTLGDEPMTGQQFREVIEAGLAEFTLGLVPSTLDQVLVSSIERSRHPPVKAVFVLGFNEGQFPARQTDDPILGEEDRARLETSGVALGPNRTQRLLDERMLAYIAFTRPSEFLWVSFPESDETGKPLAPSPYLPSLCAASGAEAIDATNWLTGGSSWPKEAGALSSVTGLASNLLDKLRAYCEERLDGTDVATWLALYNWARDSESVRPRLEAAIRALGKPIEATLTPPARAALWPAPHKTSVTALESFAACAFQHYANYGLRLEPRPLHELSRLDLGRIYHDVLEQYVNELNETGHTLKDLSPQQIAESITRLFQHVVPKYAEEIRLDPGKSRAAVERGTRELRSAKEGEQFSLGGSALKPIATEQAFGMSGENALPALALKTPGGNTVELRGKIDRIDTLEHNGKHLAVVFDYKRSLGRTLSLDEAYHGLSLQLLAYLLVIRDHGQSLANTKLIPGAAFYLPLLARIGKIDHPSELEAGGDAVFKPYRPRGVFDFDWIDALHPESIDGWSSKLQVYRKKDGTLGQEEKSDAIESGRLKAMLDHVRAKMAELADQWIGGDILVRPALHGTWSPCATCNYRSVCRIEYATRDINIMEPLKRGEVLEKVGRADG